MAAKPYIARYYDKGFAVLLIVSFFSEKICATYTTGN